MENSKKKPLFKYILIITIIIYMGLYVSLKSGYYQNNKVLYTEESISLFEKNIEDGNFIDITSYQNNQKNYNNKLSKICLTISRSIEGFCQNVFDDLYHVISYLLG